jgi:hypothetical protein
MLDWIKSRIKEMSSWSGGALIVLGLVILLSGPFLNLLAYAAIIWGIISFIKKD